MYFKQFYLGCLAQASYLIGSDGEAVVIDPQRDVDMYLDEAKAQGLKIKYIMETHTHADFVSGHIELAEKTGAKIIYGQKAGATFEHLAVKDGDELKVGKVNLLIMETPGHTPGDISILLTDTENPNEPQKVFTGDVLFIGDVGRPDLVGSKGFTAEEMATMMYESLNEKLLKLPDETEVYPAHGAGSLCGRNLSRETMSTIGEQKKFNYMLKPMTKDEFIKTATADLPEVPMYFPKDAEINRTGAGAALEKLPELTAFTPEQVRHLEKRNYLILDVRNSAAFGNAHVPNALNISLGGQFASWAGTLIEMGTPIILVADGDDEIDEAVMRLARVGIESVKGYLDGGMYAWDKAGLETATVAQMPVDELNARLNEKIELQIIDVRRPTEYNSGHVVSAKNAQLADLEKKLSEFDKEKPTAVICASGYRSSAASGILEHNGFREIYNVIGGTNAYIKAGFQVETATISVN